MCFTGTTGVTHGYCISLYRVELIKARNIDVMAEEGEKRVLQPIITIEDPTLDPSCE